MADDMKNLVFPEKYRPAKVSEMVGDFKERILNYLKNPQTIPNFIFYSVTPGSGKSSLMKAIVNELGCDYLLLNSSDDRKIETVREKIKDFAMTKSSIPGLKRAILLDEFDGMCLPHDAKVIVGTKKKSTIRKIKDITMKKSIKIPSVNVSTGKIENDMGRVANSGFADFYEIELEDGRTMIASSNHPFFEKGFVEIKTKNLIPGTPIIDMSDKTVKFAKVKKTEHLGINAALNIVMEKNKNFMLGNGILTHNTRIAQDALRNIMEVYSENVFFLLSCNNINKIIQPIQSRCVLISFAYPSKEEIVQFLERICIKEQMKYTREGIFQLIELNYPSIRNCVVVLQDLYTNNLDVIPENVKPADEVFEEMWKLLQEKRWKEIKEYVLRSNVNARELNSFFWQKALTENQLKIIQICCRNERDLAMGSDEKIILVTSLLEMVK